MIKLYKGFSIHLIPTKEQEACFWKASHTARFIYNWSLAERKRLYTEEGISETGYGMCKRLTALKKNPEYSWLNEVHNKVLKKAVLDCDEAYKRFFSGQSRFPRFHSRSRSTPSFFVESGIETKLTVSLETRTVSEKKIVKLRFNTAQNTATLSGIGTVKLSKSASAYNLGYLTEHYIPISNARVKFDGKYWCLTFSIEIQDRKQQLTDEVIGIDLGVKDTAICSNGSVYHNINKTNKNIRDLEKRKKRYQRRIARKYQANKQGNTFKKTKNIIKLECKTRIIDRRLRNIRKTYNHQISRDIVNNKPRAIVMESLNIKGMMKNKHMSKSLQNQNLYQLKGYIKYKAENQGTRFMEAPMTYKSTQTCSNCGHVHKISLSNRLYTCQVCGLILDRDLNASYNLRSYGQSLLSS